MKRLLVTFNLLCEIIPNYMHDVFSEKVKQESDINGRKLFPFLFLLDNNSKKNYQQGCKDSHLILLFS